MEINNIEKILIQNKIKKYNESFDYLINMSFKQLSKDNLDKCNKKIKELTENKKKIENKNNKQLWLDDLYKLLDNI